MNTQKNISLFVAFIVIGVMLSNTSTAFTIWQDDPFDPFATDETDVQIPIVAGDAADLTLDDSLSDGVALVIKSVRESNPSTPLELARAVKTMITIEQYQEAGRYLDRLANANLTGPQLFTLSEQMGSPFWLEVRGTPELQPQGAGFAELVIRSARNEAYAPDRINQLITELSDDNKFVRQGAFRKLQLLGGPAVSVMLEVCEDQNRRREVPFVASALKQMGEPALFPLIGVARADGTVAQAVAAGALSRIDSALAVDALLRMSISKRVPESVRAIAAEAVAQRGLLNQTDIEARIYRRANEYLEGKIFIPSDINGLSKIWNWNFANGKLLATTTSRQNAMRIMAVDLARDLYSLKPANEDYRMLQLLTVLEATKRVLGPNRFVMMDEVTSFVRDLNANDLDAGLKEAQVRMLMPAAVAAAELIGQQSDPSVLVGADGRPSTLVKAVLSGHRPLQFAAVKAITDIDPKQAFPGCSYVAQFIVMLANSNGSSSALAVHPKPEFAQSLASSIFQTGRVGLTANSSVELFEQLNNNPDIDFLIITDAMSRPHYHELVQQIRGYWISQRKPIALLIRSDERERQAKQMLTHDPLTLVMPLSFDAKSVYAQVSRLIDRMPEFKTSNVQRELQSEFAMNWLARALSDQDSYGFYGLNRFRDQLTQLVKLPGAYEVKSEILSKLGTPRSQRILVDLASDNGFSISDRQQLVNAFRASVENSGVLLSRRDLKVQNERLNASENQSKESRDLLISILDIVEAKAMESAEMLTNQRR